MASQQLSDHPSTPLISKHLLRIDPPLLNSANPWATSYDDLKSLYDCPYTGAVTIRTSLWKKFDQHPLTHQYTFFSASTGHATAKMNTNLPEGRGEVCAGETSSLNTLGYSPVAFEEYMSMLVRMAQSGQLCSSSSTKQSQKPKPFIVSVTGSVEEVGKCCGFMLRVLNQPDKVYPNPDPNKRSERLDLMMEINLSCPNVPDKPPPAYDGVTLIDYIGAIEEAKGSAPPEYQLPLHVGLKIPPYTYQGQFQTFIDVLESCATLPGGCPISFITATNTLGSCLVLDAANEPALGSVNGTGIGGLAGDALHPLALGNVKAIRDLLDSSEYEDVKRLTIIGVGGVRDAAGFRRMRSVGAAVVGVGTALGREGVAVFEKITAGLSKEELEI